MTIADFQNGDGSFTDQDLASPDTDYEYEISKSKTNNQVALSFFVGSRTGNSDGTLGTNGSVSFYGKIEGNYYNISINITNLLFFPATVFKHSCISDYKIKIRKGAGADFRIVAKTGSKISLK